MSEQDNTKTDDAPATEPKIQRQSERKRAYRIRLKLKNNEPVSDEDRAYLANYDATKQRVGRPTTVNAATDLDEDDETPDAPVNDAPPPPPPPRVKTGSAKVDDEDEPDDTWKRKYKSRDAGREQMCLMIASQWRAGLDFLNAQIVMSGGVPLVDTKKIWPAIVTTVDDGLPEKLNVKPAHIAAIGTTVILAQRVYRHKKIAEAYRNGVNPPEPPQPPTPEPPEKSEAEQVAENEANGAAKVAEAIRDEAKDTGVPMPVEPLITLGHDKDVEDWKPGPNDVI